MSSDSYNPFDLVADYNRGKQDLVADYNKGKQGLAQLSHSIVAAPHALAVAARHGINRFDHSAVAMAHATINTAKREVRQGEATTSKWFKGEYKAGRNKTLDTLQRVQRKINQHPVAREIQGVVREYPAKISQNFVVPPAEALIDVTGSREAANEMQLTAQLAKNYTAAHKHLPSLKELSSLVSSYEREHHMPNGGYPSLKQYWKDVSSDPLLNPVLAVKSLAHIAPPKDDPNGPGALMQIYKGIREHAPLNFNQAGNPFSDAIDQVLQMDPMDVGIIGGTALDGGIGLVKGLPKGLALARTGAEVFGRGVRTVGKVMSDANDHRAGFNQAAVHEMTKGSMHSHVLRVGKLPHLHSERVGEGSISAGGRTYGTGYTRADGKIRSEIQGTRLSRNERSGGVGSSQIRNTGIRSRFGHDEEYGHLLGQRAGRNRTPDFAKNRGVESRRSILDRISNAKSYGRFKKMYGHTMLSVSDKAARNIILASGRPLAESFQGLTLYDDNVPVVLKGLHKAANDYRNLNNETEAAAMEKLAKQIETLFRKNGKQGVVLIKDTAKDFHGTARHELVHFGQGKYRNRGIVDDNNNGGPYNLANLPNATENPAFAKIEKYINEHYKGYSKKMAQEVPAFLAGGYGKAAGLTKNL